MTVRLATNELEWVWKEAIVVLFEVLPRRFRGEVDENHEKSQTG
jgi:hypothetical protein